MVELPGVYSCCMNECMDWGNKIGVWWGELGVQ